MAKKKTYVVAEYVCKTCGKTEKYERKGNWLWKKRTFCSPECSKTWARKNWGK